jgi:hypothetical protein
LPEGEKCAASAKVRQAHAVAGLLHLDNDLIKKKEEILSDYMFTLNGPFAGTEKEWTYRH